MRKLKRGRKLSREKDQRKALLRSLSSSFLLRGKIKTTLAKAKETQRFAEKLITRAKKGDLASRRALLRVLPPATVEKVFKEIAPRYKERPGGYARVVKLGPRKSDGAPMAFIELVD